MVREQLLYRVATGYFYASDAAADDFLVADAGRAAEVLAGCVGALMERVPSALVLAASLGDLSRRLRRS